MGGIGEQMESAFQFTNPVLTELEFNSQDNQEVQIALSVSVQVNKSENKMEATVGLNFEIGTREDISPFYIKATEKANFRWDESLTEGMVDKLLNQNAPSLLVSYLRPIIVQITAASPYGAYNIPFINFTAGE